MRVIRPSTLLLVLLGPLLLVAPSCSLFLTKTYTWDWRRDYPTYHHLAKQMILEEAPCLLTTVPSDIERYCPQYREMPAEERLLFWSLFLSAVSWMESSHRTEHFYTEPGITDSTGNNVISRGLLQFSYESSRAYLPSISQPEDLHQPAITLRAGAVALRRFICTDRVLSAGGKGAWRGAARYWSVMRRNAKHTQIQKWLRGADYQNPRNNLIPPPPHLTKEDYEPWFQSLFRSKPTVN